MSRHLDHLRTGERWWTAEVVLRALGLGLLAGCCRMWLLAHAMVTSLPSQHQATLGEIAVCAAIVIALSSGISLSLYGPGLFEHVPIPRGSAWYWKER